MFRLSPPPIRKDKYPFGLQMALVFLISFTVYITTAARDITFAHFGSDGGELISASVTLGIPHPPGYPLYVVIGKIVSYIPIGKVAFRYSLLSVFAMAITVALVFRASVKLSDRDTADPVGQRLADITAALVFAFTPLVWSQALIAEVYALNLLMVAILINLLLGQNSVKHSFLTGLSLGLGVTTHLTTVFLTPAAFLLTDRNGWRRLFIGFGLGLTPFLLLPAFAQGGSPIIWGNPDHPLGWLKLISGSLYNQNVFARLPSESKWYVYGYYAGPFLIVTVLAALLSGRRLHPRFNRRSTVIIASAALFALYSISYATDDSVVYLLPAILLLTLLIGAPLSTIRFWSLLLPLALVGLNFAGLNLRDDNSVRRNAASLLSMIPANTVILTPGDQTISALWYFQSAEQIRDDVLIVDQVLFQFPWYRLRMGTMHPELLGLSQDNLEAFVDLNASESSPICRMSLVEPVHVNCDPARS